MIRFMQWRAIISVYGFLALFLLPGGAVLAGDASGDGIDAAPVMQALPPAAVMAEPVPEVEKTGQENGDLIFLELYTAEHCAFCPTAERHFNDMLNGENVIGMMCMVDYFDSSPSSPSSPARGFCKEQQAVYRQMMRTGSLYTPQLIVNGARETPGHNFQKVMDTIHMAQNDPVRPIRLGIVEGAVPGDYNVLLPPIRPDPAQPDEKFLLRLVMLKRGSSGENAVISSPSGQRRREHSPDHIATALIEGGLWNGRKTTWTVTPPMQGNGKGDEAFLVLVQDRDSGHVLAAGHYDLPRSSVE